MTTRHKSDIVSSDYPLALPISNEKTAVVQEHDVLPLANV